MDNKKQHAEYELAQCRFPWEALLLVTSSKRILVQYKRVRQVVRVVSFDLNVYDITCEYRLLTRIFGLTGYCYRVVL